MAAKLRFYSQKCTETYHSASHCVCNDIVQFTQHSDITGSQLQQLIDQLHLIHQTSGTTLSSSHNNLTSVSRHPIILCWLATSAAENWSANQQQNCTPCLSFSFFLQFTQTTLFSVLPALSSLNFPLFLLESSWRAPKSQGETNLRVSQSQVAEVETW